MGLIYVADTNVCLHFLRGDLAAPLPFGVYLVSAITEIELLAKPNLSPAEIADIRGYLATVSVIEISQDIRDEAARIRREYGLKLPDAIVAATALTHGADLLTNDRHMARVPGLVVTPLALRP